jgi:hypothetical protein
MRELYVVCLRGWNFIIVLADFASRNNPFSFEKFPWLGIQEYRLHLTTRLPGAERDFYLATP